MYYRSIQCKVTCFNAFLRLHSLSRTVGQWCYLSTYFRCYESTYLSSITGPRSETASAASFPILPLCSSFPFYPFPFPLNLSPFCHKAAWNQLRIPGKHYRETVNGAASYFPAPLPKNPSPQKIVAGHMLASDMELLSINLKLLAHFTENMKYR